MRKYLAVFAAAALLGACDDGFGLDGPDLDVGGSYELTALRFDPQGSLPDTDLLARMQTATIPRLVIGTDNRAQLIFENPETDLVTIVNARWSTTGTNGLRLDFSNAGNTLYRNVLFSERTTFSFDESTHVLSFSGESPDGVERERLLQLVPEWGEEQLFDPVPGVLTVVFTPRLEAVPQ